jgi:nucleotide sugar dehydrogenase
MKFTRKKKKKIGFIGQGFIGKNYADDFEERGYEVIRYARSEPYNKNKEKLKECDIVFIAVPTPTTPTGFDYSIVEGVVGLAGKGKTVVIKSTMQPGSTEKIAEKFPDIFVMHSPEFLREKFAAYDARHPDRNIVGISKDTPEYHQKAEEVLAVLAKAPYNEIMDVRSAEMIKYIGNCFLTTKVVFFNIMYDIAKKLDLEWENIREAVAADPRIGESHTHVVHESGHGGGAKRGAGGHCFIKDFAAVRELHDKVLPEDKSGNKVLTSIEKKNVELLRDSCKDLDLLEGVYGEEVLKKEERKKD